MKYIIQNRKNLIGTLKIQKKIFLKEYFLKKVDI